MLKALIKSLENKHLDPWILESLTPFFQLIGRRSYFYNSIMYEPRGAGTAGILE